MFWNSNPYSPWLLLSAAICAGLVVSVLRRRAAPGARAFILLMAATSIWAFAYAMQLAAVDFDGVFFWVRARYTGIVWVSTSWFIFSQYYAERQRPPSRRLIALLTIEPVIYLLLVWTNASHRLVWTRFGATFDGVMMVWEREHGPTFWFHFIYSYVLLLWASIAFVRALLRSHNFYKFQVTTLLLAALTPLLGNLVSTFGKYVTPALDLPFDLTPFAFTFSGLVIGLGLYGFKLLDVVPLARTAVVESLQDGLLVFDHQGVLIDVNPLAQALLSPTALTLLGQGYQQVLAAHPELRVQLEGAIAPVQILMGDGVAARWYESRVATLEDRGGGVLARIMTLHDVTAHKQVSESLQAQKHLQENLVTVARVTAEGVALEETLRRILDVGVLMTGAEGGKLFVLDAVGAVTQYICSSQEQQVIDTGMYVRQVLELGLGGWAVQHRQAVLAADTSVDVRWVPLPDDLARVRSALAVPIISDGVVLGVMILEHGTPHHFTQEHLEFMQAAVTQMSLAMRNARLFDEQQRLAAQQATLYNFMRLIGGQLNPHSLMQLVVDNLVQMLDPQLSACILVPTPDEQALMIQAASSRDVVAGGWRHAIDKGVTGRAYRKRQTQVVNDVRFDPDYLLAQPQIRSELAVPLRYADALLGVLDIESTKPHAFATDTVRLVESLAEAISLALQNAYAHAKMGRYVADLSTLYTVAQAVGQSLLLEQVLVQTLASTVETTVFDAGLIALPSDSDLPLTLTAAQGMPQIEPLAAYQQSLVETLCMHVHTQRRLLIVRDIEEDTGLADILGQDDAQVLVVMRALQLRVGVIIPLLHQDQAFGAMALFARMPLNLAAEDQAVYMAIGRQVAVAVANARLYQAVNDERSRLQALINSSRDGIVFIGVDQRILVVNQRALSLLLLSGEPVAWVGHPVAELLTVLSQQLPAAGSALLAQAQDILQGCDAQEGGYDLPRRAVHWISLPVQVEQGVVGCLWMLRDVTEERSLQKMRDDLTHAMVHDLRNPLTGISGAVKLLSTIVASDNLTPAQQQLLGIIRSSSERMLDLVNAILDISRLESGRMPLEPQPTSLVRLVDAALMLLQPLMTERQQRFERDIPAVLPQVCVDSHLFERVLQNLLGNASKFTPAAGILRVHARVEASNPDWVYVSVSDTGPGVPPEIRGQLFQKFVTGNQEGSGSGLGLTFCRMVVEAHGGRIWAEDVPGGGAQFTFTVPVELYTIG